MHRFVSFLRDPWTAPDNPSGRGDLSTLRPSERCALHLGLISPEVRKRGNENCSAHGSDAVSIPYSCKQSALELPLENGNSPPQLSTSARQSARQLRSLRSAVRAILILFTPSAWVQEGGKTKGMVHLLMGNATTGP